MLELKDLNCGYGKFRAVHGLDLLVQQRQIVALIGANGAGKSSTIMSIAGHVAVQSGGIIFEGKDITSMPVHERVRNGIAIVPEGRRIFKNLSVTENLQIGGYCQTSAKISDIQGRVFSLFPILEQRERQASGTLSGGEQQMLAIGRALMSNPKFLMVDELSLGLMPKAIEACYDVLATLRDEGMTILIVEQGTERALRFADSVCILDSGVSVLFDTAENARNSSKLVAAYLGSPDAVN